MKVEELIKKHADQLNFGGSEKDIISFWIKLNRPIGDNISEKLNFYFIEYNLIHQFKYCLDWEAISFYNSYSSYIKNKFSQYIDWDIVKGDKEYIKIKVAEINFPSELTFYPENNE